MPSTGAAFVVKQALPQLRVRDEWLATPDRAETEVAAMVLCGAITPGVVPAIIDSDPAAHVLVMELIPAEARNWQAEVGEGRVHADGGSLGGSDARRLARRQPARAPLPRRASTTSRRSSSCGCVRSTRP